MHSLVPPLLSVACARTVLPDPAGRLVEKAALIDIEGPTIKKIETCAPGEFDARVRLWRETRSKLHVYTGKLLTPAFVNAHTHLAMSFFRGIAMNDASAGNMVEDLFFRLESRLTARDVRAFAHMGAYECLLNGVGLVWDHYYHASAIAEALVETGLCGVVAPTLQDLAGPFEDDWESAWEDTESLAAATDLRKRGVYVAFGPHATDTVSAELFQKIGEASAKLKLPVHMHLAQSFEELQRIQAREGCSPLTFLQRTGLLSQAPQSLLVHSIFVQDAELAMLDPAKHTLGFCPFSAMIFCFPANILKWHSAKMPFIVATDCVASNDSMNVQKELRYVAGFPLNQLSFDEGEPSSLLAKRQKLWREFAVLSAPEGLLSRVWSLPGRMHPQFRAGVIAEGALANLVVWDSDEACFWPGTQLRTLAFGDTSAGIYQMILAGRKIAEDGAFAASIRRSQQYKEARQEASERLQSLLA